MKTIYSIGTGILAMSCLCSCSNNNDPAQPGDTSNGENNKNLATAILEIPAPSAEAANRLGFEIMDKWSAGQTTNLAYSPLSVIETLAMCINGADNETMTNLTVPLHLNGNPGEKLSCLNDLCREISGKLPLLDSKAIYLETNSLWLAPGLDADANYAQQLESSLGGQVIANDPSGMAGMRDINAWVKSNTNGLIDPFLTQPLTGNMAMLNTVYFKGSWKEVFDRSLTRALPFHNLDGSESQADYMCMTGLIESASNANGQSAVSLPFGNGTFSMAFIDNNGKPLEYADWQSLKNNFRPELFTLNVPKFDVSEGFEVIGVLESLYPGILDNAVFNRILTTQGNCTLNKLLTKSRVKIDEEGCEAAGSSLADMYTGTGDDPAVKLFDKPFSFIIYEKTTGIILFQGRINKF